MRLIDDCNDKIITRNRISYEINKKGIAIMKNEVIFQ
jgi:hypothetical protein